MRLGEFPVREAGSASRLDPQWGVGEVAGQGINLSCWVSSVVTNGAMTVNIAATGSTAGAVSDVALVVALGPTRPRGFVGCDGATLQWVSSDSDGGSLTPPRPAFCNNRLVERSEYLEDSHSQFRLPIQRA